MNAAGTETLVYIGTYTEPILFGTGQLFPGKGRGIHRFALDGATGALEPRGVVAGVANPSWLAFDPRSRYAFAVNELKRFEGEATGTVSSFAVDPSTGNLSLVDRRPTGGTDPCHVAVDPAGRFLFVANFSSGSVCVLPVDADGRLGRAVDFVQHHGSSVDPHRQQGPHAHCTVLDPSGRFALVADLGLDRVMIYRFEARTGRLTPGPTPWMAARPGAGPRQLAFHPGGRFVYVINELDSTIVACSFDPATGGTAEIQTLSALPAGFAGASSASDVQLLPSGDFLYASNRGHDSIVIHRVDPRTGRLELVGHESTGGKVPRGFGIDPTGSFLLAANLGSDTVVTFRIDRASGRLQATGHVAEVGSPVCVRLLPRR